MTEPNGDEMIRMARIFNQVPPAELDYLLAMLALPDGVGRMKMALLQLLTESHVSRNRGYSLSPEARRRRETLFVLLSDVAKLPGNADVAAVAHQLLGADYPLERFKGLSRRKIMYMVWMKLQQLPPEQQDQILGQLINEFCDKPVDPAGQPVA